MTETRQTGQGMKPWVLHEVDKFVIKLLDDLLHGHVSVAAVLPVHLLLQGDGVELVLDHWSQWLPLHILLDHIRAVLGPIVVILHLPTQHGLLSHGQLELREVSQGLFNVGAIIAVYEPDLQFR